jgi:hypothetical protein
MSSARPADILICPVEALGYLNDAERDVLRRVLFQKIRGMTRDHDARWRRLWGDLMNAQPGEGFLLFRVEERSGPFHRRHRAILERLFQNQDRFANVERLHDWLKVGAGFVLWDAKTGKPVPRSTSFPETSEDEMREFHRDMVDFLRTERAQRFLWRHLKPKARGEMVEAILSDQQEEHA